MIRNWGRTMKEAMALFMLNVPSYLMGWKLSPIRNLNLSKNRLKERINKIALNAKTKNPDPL